MAYWLFKTEPHVFSIQQLQASHHQTTRWDGVRNYQARNFLRDGVKLDDDVFIYHSQCKQPAIVGLAKVVTAAYADPAQFDLHSDYFDPAAKVDLPRWFAVDIQHQFTAHTPITLQYIKTQPTFQSMVLLKQGRLSIQPVSPIEAAELLTRLHSI